MEEHWSYETAFCRNLGLINPQEQAKLRRSCIAIPGMGGVGGHHLMTLARLGIGSFRIADPDQFEPANFNRQYGALTPSLGRNKAEVMAEAVRQLNPEVEIEVFREQITSRNVDRFLEGVDVLVDAIDFFSFDIRRLLFREIQQRGKWGVTAGPIGFSTAWLTFDPRGMSFDRYFDMRDGMDSLDLFAAFAVGLAPWPTHFQYLDLSFVDRAAARGPSLGLACNLCSGVAAAEVAKILLGRGPQRPVPYYAQFDAYRCLLRRGCMWWGNRNPLQRIKRHILKYRMQQLGFRVPAATHQPPSREPIPQR